MIEIRKNIGFFKNFLNKYNDTDGILIGNNIPRKKYNNAMNEYVKKGNQILALIDITLFGSATDGIAITDYGIEWKDFLGEVESFSWDKIVDKFTIIEEMNDIVIESDTIMFINNKKISTAGSGVSTKIFKSFLEDIVKNFILEVSKLYVGGIVAKNDRSTGWQFAMVVPNNEVIRWELGRIRKTSLNDFLIGNDLIKVLSRNYKISFNEALKEAYSLIGTKETEVDMENIKYKGFPFSLRNNNLTISTLLSPYIENDEASAQFFPNEIIKEIFTFFNAEFMYISNNNEFIRSNDISNNEIKELENLIGSKVECQIQKINQITNEKENYIQKLVVIIFAICEIIENDNEELLKFIKTIDTNYQSILIEVSKNTNKYIKIVLDEISNVENKEKLNEILTQILELTDDVDLETTIERFQEYLN